MDDILHMSKATHNEIQRTKDIVSNIQSDTTQNKIYGSFHSKFVEDEDEEIFREGSGCKSSEFDKPGFHSQQSQVIGSMEEDCLSKEFIFSLEYVITTNEDFQDGTNEIEENSGNVVPVGYKNKI